MTLTQKKNALEVYGIFRLMIGVSQLTGLSAGFFLKEWVMRYPASAQTLVLTSELLTLAYIVILVRAAFHCVVGAGMARLKRSTCYWIYLGWPLVGMLTYVFVLMAGQVWTDTGLIGQLQNIISWPRLLVYAGFILIDYFIVTALLKKVDEDPESRRSSPISGRDLTIIVISICLISGIIFFMGRGIGRGYHRGFYKSRGKANTVKTRAVGKKQAANKSRSSVVSGGTLGRDEPKQISDDAKFLGYAVSRTEVQSDQTAKMGSKSTSQKHEPKKDWPYAAMVAALAGVMLVLGFLYQIFEIIQTQSVENISLNAYAFFAMGFSGGLFYGFLIKNMLMGIFSFVLLCLSVAMTFLIKRY